MKKQQLIKLLTFLGISCLIIFLIVYFADDTFARPGGGHGHHSSGGYSGGYHSSGGGYHGGGSVFITDDNWWIWLILAVAFRLVVNFSSTGGDSDSHNKTVKSSPTPENIMAASNRINEKISKLISIDSNFSKPIFLDFANVLFTKLHYYSGEGQVQKLSPFFEGELQNWEKYTVSELSIASVRIVEINLNPDGNNTILVNFEADYTTNMRPEYGGKSIRRSTTQNWLFARPYNAQSLQPEGFGTLRCPNCGAAANFTDAGICPNCGTHITSNNGQWVVRTIKVSRMEGFNSQDMLDYAEEVGTNSKTIVSNSLMSNAETFVQLHPDIASPSTSQNYVYSGFIKTIAEPYFMEIYQNWSNGTWNNVRHLISDRQWQSMDMYMQRYKSYGYRNVLENVVILRSQPADYTIDNNYESITIRIYARCLDYVVSKHGNKLAGDNRTPRKFSEYWTFVCKRGVTAKNTGFKNCPCCGAPADNMGQGGICGYCGSKITDANFSWVLFSITQDEEYRG